MSVILDRPRAKDRVAFLAAVKASRKFHRPWLQAPDTAVAYRHYLHHYLDPRHETYLLRDAATGAPAGVFNVSEIVRGCFRSAYLAFYALAPYAGRGHMTAGLQLVLREAFRGLGLHRLEANIQPGNVRSIALVQRCGFELEGYSPRYLKIGGRWRDHERWAVLRDRRGSGGSEGKPGERGKSGKACST